MKRILVPTDFSASAQKALELARHLCPQAKIGVLHVFDASAMYAPYADGIGPLYLMEEANKGLQTETLHRLREWCQKGEESWQVVGQPAEAILREAKEFQADGIFMGTHGRRGFSHLLFGSVAEQVVRQSPVPVMVVRAVEH
ncbi:universal stress protein [Deinococcus cellulosilyticus]|uniref:UspA domain-containing protein n=1 Tax=Deinococcus cellulosilyticus (strain DSM 18568 / NBRC 106333 / KACC 11606 / 5516J-15) TaxID=1223518 RepID=A0A511N786_DEIC1|nr:universal stress protein [Deinococcus cellulosilyticus]GEM48338.1 hypothetical protein DC3_39730 [Deinococcus cellulosilyticus NBRC 106333 = KACC 11606]